MTLDLSQAMKQGMRRLAAGVCVVTAKGADNAPIAMTASSVTSVSDAPASLLVCVNRSAHIHSVLNKGHRFAVNVLAQSHEDISKACAGGDDVNSRFDAAQWRLSKNALPTLVDALAVFSCTVTQTHPYGTHSIVIGDINHVTVDDTEPRGLTDNLSPLLYFNGAYATIG